jgi:hypothetical protein
MPDIEGCAQYDCDAITSYSHTALFPELLVMEYAIKDRRAYEAKIWHGSTIFLDDVFVVRYSKDWKSAVITRPDGAVQLPSYEKVDLASSDDIARVILGIPLRTA